MGIGSSPEIEAEAIGPSTPTEVTLLNYSEREPHAPASVHPGCVFSPTHGLDGPFNT